MTKKGPASGWIGSTKRKSPPKRGQKESCVLFTFRGPTCRNWGGGRCITLSGMTRCHPRVCAKSRPVDSTAAGRGAQRCAEQSQPYKIILIIGKRELGSAALVGL